MGRRRGVVPFVEDQRAAGPGGEVDRPGLEALDQRHGERRGTVRSLADDPGSGREQAGEFALGLREEGARRDEVERGQAKARDQRRGEERLAAAGADVDESAAAPQRLADDLLLVVVQRDA